MHNLESDINKEKSKLPKNGKYEHCKQELVLVLSLEREVGRCTCEA